MAAKKRSPLLFDVVTPSITDTFSALTKAEPRRSFVKMVGEPEAMEDTPPSLVKSILNILNGPRDSVERLAFETDPSLINQYQSVYRAKVRLIPDSLLKRIIIQDDLVAAIIRARETQMSAFGRPRPDRFSTGYVIEPNAGVVDKLTPEQKVELEKRIEAVVRSFETCGETRGWSDNERISFSQYLQMSTRNAVGLGRIATEIVRTTDANTNLKRFHSFRPADAGTIYKAAPKKSAEDAVRKQARILLEQMKNKKLEPERYQNDEYAWVQVIDARPVQAFTAEELVVHNFFPVPDVELDGYPVTPIDTMISAVTTHINITTHNKIYFQTGRASKGMLLFKSDDIDEQTLHRVKQQFNASINSVNNSWRMPVFAVGTNDEITWQPIDSAGSKDGEFQYLNDMNARIILSAFQMSPDELPGWSYLSRGTNNQALSESNNEYRLEAARDLGIRPLMAQFEDFINMVLFPLMDENLSKLCRLKLKGLDAETEEKESVRLQQDMPVHMTYDEVNEKVEKRPVGRAMGGDFPMNPQYQAILDKYLTVGQVMEFFFDAKGASKDPSLQYRRDPFFFQWVQLQQAQDQMKQQEQMQQAQMQQGGAPAGGAPGGDQSEPADDSKEQPQSADQGGQQSGAPAGADQAGGQPPGEDLTRSIDQAISLLTKGEDQLPLSKRKLLAQHRRTIEHIRLGLENDVRHATKEILALAALHSKKAS